MATLLLLDNIFQLPVEKDYSTQIFAADSSLLGAYLTSDDKWRMRTTLEEVNPDLVNALLTKEDKRFYYHFGVDPFAALRGNIYKFVQREDCFGASTITMQLARMLEPAERTYISKIIEIIRAFQLEMHYSKKEILEMYFSLLPYGGNIEGIKAASLLYFNRLPGNISLSESISLAIIPNNPNQLRPDRNSEQLMAEKKRWCGIFRESSAFGEGELDAAEKESVAGSRYSIALNAPHFCRRIKDEHKSDRIYTSLDRQIQYTAENLLKNYVERARGRMVNNGAVLVVDNIVKKVVAYCGSADFHNNEFSGQVDGIISIRSPGSALKPFLYAHCFDKGELTPMMKIEDIPFDFGGYEPENYTLEFNGEVTARYALSNSLNIPAVRLLRRTGFRGFFDLIDDIFPQIKRDKERMGLSMILGGCGVTLEELVTAYSSFANGGQLFRPGNLKESNEKINIPFLSPGASFLIWDILSNAERPDFAETVVNDSNLPRFAWKTGTSYGKRDAWSIGFNRYYTIGVWMGNFDGRGSPWLSGAEMATPLLFELFGAINYGVKDESIVKPEEVGIRQVCAVSGLPPSEYCENLIEDYFIRNVTLTPDCDRKIEIFTNEEGTIEYCTDCLPDSGYSKKIVSNPPPELALWSPLKENTEDKRPPHNPFCSSLNNKKILKIISPLPDYEYYVEKGKETKILLQAAVAEGIKKIYWYLNGKFFSASEPSERIFFQPVPGKNKITCVDDSGQKAVVEIEVKTY